MQIAICEVLGVYVVSFISFVHHIGHILWLLLSSRFNLHQQRMYIYHSNKEYKYTHF